MEYGGGWILSSVDGNGKGNLLISYLFKNNSFQGQIEEEKVLKVEIQKLMDSKGYKFIIIDDQLINEKLAKG